jgi:predicted phage terminase large subunit-like protein
MTTTKKVEDYLNNVSYKEDSSYLPSIFALNFINFIKLVNGSQGEEHKTPVIHLKMLDTIQGTDQDVLNMLFRGSAKTTVMAEYLILYIATYGEIENFGKIPLGLYVSDSIENGVKNMRKNLEYRWGNSEFLQTYVPYSRFTEVRWEFKNIEGSVTIFKGYGAKTGVRGSKELAQRPYLAILDDLVSDEDARSVTVITSIEDTVYKAIDYALHPTRRKVIWNGTPFNSRDPLYKAIESGAWKVNVFPVCEQFPCTEEEFKGAWEDRFTYKYVKEKYTKALLAGKIDAFNQELMLRIMSDEDRLVPDTNIRWYKRESVLSNKGIFNFYISTDLATKEKEANDFSVISVWAYNANGDWFWVDGVCKKQTMNITINDIFRLAQIYKPQEVGIETNGQQYAFISWLQTEMMNRNIWFNFASNSAEPGIKSSGAKFDRFRLVSPWFETHKMFFPEELKLDPCMVECMDELRLVSKGGFKSKHDDFCFSGDTLIKEKLFNGYIRTRRIDQLIEESVVEAFDEQTGVFSWVEIKDYMCTGSNATLTITDSVNNSIHLTYNHPVLTKRGWVNAGDLTLEDLLVCKHSAEQKIEYRPIKSITHKSDSERVYNFSTPLHTYCVNGDIVVHNCDSISQLALMSPWKPSSEVPIKQNQDNHIWELDIPDETNYISSYIV